MKNLIIILISVNFIFLQDNLYESFEIPKFESKTLSVSGEDLLSLKKQGDNSEYSFNLGGLFLNMSQSPLFTLNYGVHAKVNSSKGMTDSTSITDIVVSAPFSGSKYFTDDYLGAHAYFGESFDLSISDATTTTLELEAGAGYGRITSARPVSQAVILSDVLDADLSNEEIIEVSKIIAKASSGYYTDTYKTDADIYFYRDLSEAARSTDKMMQIQQVLSNPAYANISDKYTGWMGRVGYKNTMLNDSGSDGMITASAHYAKPIDKNQQLYAGLDYNMALDSGAESTADIFVNYSLDHSHTWTTKAETLIEAVMPDGSDMYSTLNLTLSSTRVILNSLSATGAFSLVKAGSNNDAMIELNAMFTYYIF